MYNTVTFPLFHHLSLKHKIRGYENIDVVISMWVQVKNVKPDFSSEDILNSSDTIDIRSLLL